MINFDAVDFSECRSEEVMFLLTLSVVFILMVSNKIERSCQKLAYL